MNKYETIVIIKSNISKSKDTETIRKIEDKIKEYGEISEEQDMGTRKMAYEVKNNSNGHYFVIRHKISETQSPEAIRELERLLRITDEVLKYLTIKI